MRKVVFALSLMFSLYLLSGVYSVAENLNEVKNKKKEVDSKINSLSQRKKQEMEALKSALTSIKKLKENEKKVSQERGNLLQNYSSQNNELNDIETALQDTEDLLNETRDLFKRRVRAMYVNSGKTPLDILIQSENLVELTGRYHLLKNIAKNDREVIERYKTAKEDMEFKKRMKAMEVARLQAKIQQTTVAMSNIKADQTNFDQKVKGINETLKKIEMEEDALLAESANLAYKIKNYGTSNKKYAGGKLIWPAPSSSVITSPFGMSMHPVLKYKRMHTGLDIAAGMGASIVAANKGVVKGAGWEGGYGKTVIIDHGGGIVTLYAHCSEVLVKEGDKVDTAQTIAKVGSTGISTGPHLHFEVRLNGEPVNPRTYLGG